MDYNIQLDYILEQLLVDYENRFKGVKFYSEDVPTSTREEITKKIKTKFDLKDWEINVLYHQLLVDNYIKSIEPLAIALDGLIFIKNGGYMQKNVQLQAENKRIKTLENDLKKYSLGLMIFTGIVALGTLISAWFFAIEIWKYYIK